MCKECNGTGKLVFEVKDDTHVILTYEHSCPKCKVTMLSERIGVFNPKNLQTLREEPKPFIGQVILWRALWVIEDGEVYAGQWVYEPLDVDTRERLCLAGWVPAEDIEF